jgi:Tfp pilus assembly protein FimT
MQFGALDRPLGLTGSRVQPPFARQDGYSLIDILMVVALVAVICGVAVPVTGNAVAGQKFKGDSQTLTNLVALAKMRASATFTRARVRANLDANTYVLERWDKPSNQWVQEGGISQLSRGVTFGFGTVSIPPPNTQSQINFSPECRTGVTAGSTVISGSACVIFNSRGIPVDADGASFGGHALYLTNGNAVSATTVTATPRIRRWWTWLTAPSWKEQQ